MSSDSIQIQDVSDTSLWVAYYRAKETERPDALFRDPFAKALVGERGQKIANSMKKIGRYTEWSVVSRTVIIDRYIQNLIQEGIDTVINLGAGLDTRPYRMDLPNSLRWIEVDYPHINELKEKTLKNEKPRCQLTRVNLDLADNEKRKQFLKDEGAKTRKALVITEGVIPYLTPEQVTALSNDLQAESSLQFWITEYFHSAVYRYLKHSVRTKRMQNAPFQFYPDDWFGFFGNLGWEKKDIQFANEIAVQFGRKIPMPWFGRIFMLFASKERLDIMKRMSGHVLWKKKSSGN